MTTPAQDAPLVFPSVAFRPVRLLVVCVALTALALVAAGFGGNILYGAFFGVGLGLGLLNALLVRRAVENSATRLLVITAVALTVAFLFKSNGGIAVLFGLAIFQALLVMSTSIPVLRKIRSEGLNVADTEAKD